MKTRAARLRLFRPRGRFRTGAVCTRRYGMVKNVLIVLLAAACLFFGVDRYGSFLQKDEEISAGEYGGLLSLRELYSAGDYEEKVLPLLREAFVDGKVTRERMQKLDGKLNDLGLRVFERLTRQDTKSRVSRAWDDARDSAAKLGEKLGRKMDDAMRGLGESLEEVMPRRSPAPKRENSVSL